MNRVGLRVVLPMVCIALLLGGALQGCRKDEQGRVLLYQKGTYLGKADEKLTPSQVEALRHRVANEQDP